MPNPLCALGNFPTLTFENLQDVVATNAGIGTEPQFLKLPTTERSAIAPSISTTSPVSQPANTANLDLKWNGENLSYNLPTSIPSVPSQQNTSQQNTANTLTLAAPTFTDWQTNWPANFNTAFQAIPLISFQIATNLTDPTITDPSDPTKPDTSQNFAVTFNTPPITAKNQLLIFLPGTAAPALGYQNIAKEAANLGYHVIVLNYNNTDSVASACVNNPDATSYEKVRLEVLDGVDRTPLITVTTANSIQNRLVKMLQTLNNQNPTQGWGQYLQGSTPSLQTPNWQQMIVSGHSQGGAEAAIIGKQYQVARVVMFAPGNDPSTASNAVNGLAPWISKPGATSSDRYYGFKNTNDTATGVLSQAYTMWTQLGMDAYGSTINVDGSNPNFSQSHKFITSLNSIAQDAHNSLIVDNTDPVFLTQTGVAPDNNPLVGPVYSNTWQYVLSSDTAAPSAVTYKQIPSNPPTNPPSYTYTDNNPPSLSGTTKDDSLNGTNGNNVISGGDGNDIITAQGGNDIIDGGNGNDTISSSPKGNPNEIDIINGRAGNDNITGSDGADILLGEDGNDTISGNGGNDQIDGGNGNNIIDGGVGDDQIIGGTGNDTLTGDDGNDTINTGDGTNTVDGGNGNDNITGGTAGDSITGGAGNDIINGAAGNDTLNGGDGNDTINGGDGNDIIDGGAGDNTLSGGNGNDVINAGSGINVLDGGAGTDTLNFNNTSVTGGVVVDVSLGNFEAISGALNFTNQITASLNKETISGGNLNDVLNGNGGNDIINGGAGDDQITGGSGNDTLSGNDGNDTINSGNGKNTVDGGNGNDLITGGTGVDSLTGGTGNDTISGMAGGDTLNGGDGDDTLNGGDGNDTIVGSNGNDIIDGGAGKDTLSYAGMTVGVTVNLGNTVNFKNIETVVGATNFSNTLTGGSAAESLVGGNVDDILSGGVGNDVLTGGTGNDILTGGTGNDTLTGGTGADRFTFNSLIENRDNITDFTVSQGDQIVVSAAGFKGGLVAGTPLSTAQLVIGTAATQGIGQFIYNNSLGKLLFDEDGTGAGAAVEIAFFTVKPTLTTSSFTVIA